LFGSETFHDQSPEGGLWHQGSLASRRLTHFGSARHHGGGRSHFGRGHFRWGGGGFPEPFFGRGPKVGRGDVRAAILALLAERPMHGYQIIQELSERSGGLWRPSPGSIYPTLQFLEDEGLVRSEVIDGRRVFHLTDVGNDVATKRGEGVAPPWDVAAGAGPLVELREVGFGVVAAVMQVAQTGTARQIAKTREILSDARKRIYRLLGEDDAADEGKE
jgi:DNA-binding PadR family transcriptional regulator